ncbi:MAG: hypothetical protein FJW83_01165 [Actinobacteria bacterium]|nr:hypothetical protein [Actinomycetota bacterium]
MALAQIDMAADEMLEPEDRAFVRTTALGVLVGVAVVFGLITLAVQIVAGGLGWWYTLGVATFASVVTGGFFGGVVFASRHLIVHGH